MCQYSLKRFCSLKHMIKKMKGQNTEWEKIFLRHTINKDYYIVGVCVCARAHVPARVLKNH